MKRTVICGRIKSVLLFCVTTSLLLVACCGSVDAFAYGGVSAFTIMLVMEAAFRMARPGECLVFTNLEIPFVCYTIVALMSLKFPFYVVSR